MTETKWQIVGTDRYTQACEMCGTTVDRVVVMLTANVRLNTMACVECAGKAMGWSADRAWWDGKAADSRDQWEREQDPRCAWDGTPYSQAYMDYYGIPGKSLI